MMETSHINISFMLTKWYAAKSLQSCLTLCDPIEGSPPGSPVPGILYNNMFLSPYILTKYQYTLCLLEVIDFCGQEISSFHNHP